MITYRQLGRNGRLGNQLWQIAGTIGVARRRNEPAGFPFWRYHAYFSLPDDLFPDLSMVNGEDLGLDYFQDLRHLSGIEDLVRQYFTPRPEVWATIAHRFRDVLALPHRTAVHVRRGDYLDHRDLFPPLPLDYYREAMTLTSGPYLVFSDDMAWCRAQLPGDCIFVEHNRDFEDLFLMTKCDEHITANSTFSWWGAWLAGARAIYPSTWGPGFAHEAPAAVMPTGAIVLDVPESADVSA
ncbi:MAG TPA: alpha-1,2-fucosyltransferase [Acidimicrobiales bacterium]|nr:alpha-1,2-fucosyltransferase [Acidimicrobiales bacterium]